MSPQIQPGDQEISAGEMRRWLGRLEKKLDELKVVQPDVYEADKRMATVERMAIMTRVTSLEEHLDTKASVTDLADVRALALWAIALLATAVLGGGFYSVLTVVR